MPTSFTTNLQNWYTISDVQSEAMLQENIINMARYQDLVFEALRPDTSSRVERMLNTKRHKKEEIEAVQHFIDTGCSDTLTLKANSDSQLTVYGKNIQNRGKIAFMLDAQTITLHNKRSQHLVPLLEDLAAREGLTLNYVDDWPNFERGARLAYWHFKTGKEVDDNEIMRLAQPRQPDDRSSAFYGNVVYGSNEPMPRPTIAWDEVPF